MDFVAAHNASFDRSVLLRCCAETGLSPPPLTFQYTVRLAREVWGLRPTTLPDVCRHLEIPLRHHDAMSDAEACAKIVLAAGQSRTDGPPSLHRGRGATILRGHNE